MMERVNKHGASEILGVPPRTVVSLAPKIPGSARIGRGWTFDVAQLREYVRQKCEKPRRDVSGVIMFSGDVSKLAAVTSDDHYEQMIRRLRGKGGMSGRTA